MADGGKLHREIRVSHQPQDENDDSLKQRQRTLLLHFAGPDVQEIFPDTGTDKGFGKTVEALKDYFILFIAVKPRSTLRVPDTRSGSCNRNQTSQYSNM